jgi:hypothetical protein
MSRFSIRRKAFKMSPGDANRADRRERFRGEEEVDPSGVEVREEPTRLHAQSAVKTQNYRSNQEVTNQYTAETASKSARKAVQKIWEDAGKYQ